MTNTTPPTPATTLAMILAGVATLGLMGCEVAYEDAEIGLGLSALTTPSCAQAMGSHSNGLFGVKEFAGSLIVAGRESPVPFMGVYNSGAFFFTDGLLGSGTYGEQELAADTSAGEGIEYNGMLYPIAGGYSAEDTWGDFEFTVDCENAIPIE